MIITNLTHVTHIQIKYCLRHQNMFNKYWLLVLFQMITFEIFLQIRDFQYLYKQ